MAAPRSRREAPPDVGSSHPRLREVYRPWRHGRAGGPRARGRRWRTRKRPREAAKSAGNW